MTKQELLQEGNILSSTIHTDYDRSIQPPLIRGVVFDDEQRYKNWLEIAQRYVYEHPAYPEQYEEFKKAKDYGITPESHRTLLAIINSID